MSVWPFASSKTRIQSDTRPEREERKVVRTHFFKPGTCTRCLQALFDKPQKIWRPMGLPSRERGSWVGSLWWTKPTDRPPVWRASEMQRQVSVIILLGSSFVVFRFLLFDWTPSRGCPWGPIKLFLDGPLSRNEGFIDWSDCCGLRFRNVARGVKRLYWSRRWNLFDSNWWWWWITTSVLRSRDE